MAAILHEFCRVNQKVKYFLEIDKTNFRTPHNSGTLQEDIDIFCDPIHALLTSSIPSNNYYLS